MFILSVYKLEFKNRGDNTGWIFLIAYVYINLLTLKKAAARAIETELKKTQHSFWIRTNNIGLPRLPYVMTTLGDCASYQQILFDIL